MVEVAVVWQGNRKHLSSFVPAEAGWMNACYYLANQLRQNLEVRECDLLYACVEALQDCLSPDKAAGASMHRVECNN